jgi:hypothetical protein
VFQYSDPIASITIGATDLGLGDTLSISYSYSTDGGGSYTNGLPSGLTGTHESADRQRHVADLGHRECRPKERPI